MREKRFGDGYSLGKKEKLRIVLKIKNFLSSQKDIVFAYLFGSFIEESKFRDIDLGVYILNQKKEKIQESDMSAELTERIGYPVEAIIINDAPVSVQMSILRKGKVILCNSEEKRTDFIDDVSRRYREYSHLRNIALWS